MSNLVVKDNALIEASYTLDVVEQRLILLAIVEARESKTVIKAGQKLRIHASSYINQFGVEKHTAYEAIKRAVDGLFEQHFEYCQPDEKTAKIGVYKSRWVDKVGYIDDMGCIELVFASDVIPLITRLEANFTSYEIEQVSQLSSSYAIRLYELLVKWRTARKTPLIPLEEFRLKLGVIEGQYATMSNFKTRVLDLAVSQINETTDIVCKYKQHKAGRTITGFSFTFYNKPKKEVVEQPKDGRDQETPDMFNGLSEEQIKYLSKHRAFTQKHARAGESWDSLEERIRTQLTKDPAKFGDLTPYLNTIKERSSK